MRITRFCCFILLALIVGCSSDEGTLTVGPDVMTSDADGDASSNPDALPSEDATPACEPVCDDKVCGDDGCGGDCGACDEGTACDSDGQCACVPDCTDRVCGDDGCGGSCGGCGDIDDPCLDEACVDGQCIESALEGPCDDSDPCTVNDLCQDGVCAGSIKDCDDQNACTADNCVSGSCAYVALDNDDCALVVTLVNPPRASVRQDLSTLVVEGTVSSPAAVIDHVALNGQDVAVKADGTFSTLLPNPVAGVTILEVSADNALGQTDWTSHAVLASDAYQPLNLFGDNALIDNAMTLWLSADAFDDNDRSDVDDLTTLAWMFFDTVDKDSLIPSPLFPLGDEPYLLGCKYDDVTLSQLSFDIDDAAISLAEGEMVFDFELDNFSVYAAIKSDDGVIGVDTCPDAIGTVSADKVDVEARITVTVDIGTPTLVVDPDQLDVVVYELNMELEQGALSILPDGLINFALGTFEDQFIAELKLAMASAVIPSLNELIVSLTSYDREVLLPSVIEDGPATAMSVSLRLGSASVSPDGLTLAVDSGTSTEPTIPTSLIDKMPGSFSEMACDVEQELSDKLEKTSDVEALIDVDLINQILHGLWTSGYTHLDLESDTLSELFDDPVLANATIELKPQLPVVMTTCTDSGDVSFEVGDLLANITFLEGSFVSVYLSMIASADLSVAAVPDAPDVISLQSLTVDTLVLDIQDTQALEFLDINGLRLLLTTLIEEQLAGDFMFSLLDGLLRGLPLPQVSLDSLLVGLPEGTELGFEPSVLSPAGQHVLFGGELTAPDSVVAPAP